MTPVAIVRPRDVGATATLAVMPKGFAAVSYPPASQRPLALSSLAPPAIEPLQLKGTTLTLTASSTHRGRRGHGPGGFVPAARPVSSPSR